MATGIRHPDAMDGHDPHPGRLSNRRVVVYRRFFNPDEAVAQTLDARGSANECASTASRRPYIW